MRTIVEDVFTIRGHGRVVALTLRAGCPTSRDALGRCIVRRIDDGELWRVAGVERIMTLRPPEPKEGDSVGLLLWPHVGTMRRDVLPGDEVELVEFPETKGERT